MKPINRHAYLEVLINLILHTYFNNTPCVLHYHDNNDTLVHIQRLPVISRRIEGVENLVLDVRQKCRLFLLYCENAREAFESTEMVIRIESITPYNNRRYIIIVNNDEAFADLFNSIHLSFVRDLLVISVLSANKIDDFQERNYNYRTILSNITDNADISSNVSFDLFTHKFIGEEGNNDPILLDTWFANNYSYKYGNNLLPNKVSNNYGRELRAPCSDLSPYAICNSDPPKGNEYNVIVEYSKRFNYTLNVYINNSYGEYGEIYTNWNGFGTLGRLISEDDTYCEIVYGGFPSPVYVDGVRSVLYSYVVSVPLPTIKYGFFMFMEVFTIEVWFAIMSMYLVIRLLVYLETKYLYSGNDTNINALMLYGALLNQPVTLSNDMQNSFFVKCVIQILIIASLWLGTAYNSRLASVMVTPVLENDYNNLAELSDSDLKLLFFDAYYDLLTNDTRNVYQKLYSKIVLLRNDNDSEKYLSSGKYAVARYRRQNGEYFEEEEHLLQMKGKYKPITPEIFNNFYYILLRKNSIHSEMVRTLVSTLEEVGLMKFWEDEALRMQDRTLFQKEMQEYSIINQNTKINMLHLKGIFTFWFFGLIISLLVFFKELFYNIVSR